VSRTRIFWEVTLCSRSSEQSRLLHLEGSSSERVRFFFDYFTVKTKAPGPSETSGTTHPMRASHPRSHSTIHFRKRVRKRRKLNKIDNIMQNVVIKSLNTLNCTVRREAKFFRTYRGKEMPKWNKFIRIFMALRRTPRSGGRMPVKLP
jgi:hypothetical protein